MRLLVIILLGVAANLDNLCIGVSYGLSGKSIKLPHNLIISCISGVFAFAACEAAQMISQSSLKYTLYAGSVLLIVIGLYTIIAAFRKKTDICRGERREAARNLSFREILMLGVVLAVNSLVASFAAGLAETPPLPLSVSVTLLSVLFISLGNLLGKRISELWSGKLLDVISGLMLIAVGIWEMLM